VGGGIKVGVRGGGPISGEEIDEKPKEEREKVQGERSNRGKEKNTIGHGKGGLCGKFE